jgi:hypothetical protein
MQTFNTESGQIVLKDLENRCFKHDTTHFPGDRESVLINEGRRQVLLHIETMMSPEGIAALAEKPEERKEE